MSREEHNKSVMIENLVWEIAKIVSPNSYIEPKKVKKGITVLLNILQSEEK